MTISKRLRQKGAPNDNQDPDLDAFLKPSNQDYYQASASGVGYAGSRWDDNAGTHSYGQGIDGADDNAAFLEPSTVGGYTYDRPHQELYSLIDNQVDLGSGNKLTGGGGPVSDNKQGGVGPGKPRYAPKNVGARGQNNTDARGGRNGRR